MLGSEGGSDSPVPGLTRIGCMSTGPVMASDAGFRGSAPISFPFPNCIGNKERTVPTGRSSPSGCLSKAAVVVADNKVDSKLVTVLVSSLSWGLSPVWDKWTSSKVVVQGFCSSAGMVIASGEACVTRMLTSPLFNGFWNSSFVLSGKSKVLPSFASSEKAGPVSGEGSLTVMHTFPLPLVWTDCSWSSAWLWCVPDRNNSGKFNHAPPSSDSSLASEAREDLRDEARLPRWTWRNADRRLCHPPPGLDVCVISSSKSRGSLSLSRFNLPPEQNNLCNVVFLFTSLKRWKCIP